mmetsp:Transcript_35868/g.83636  ORF Transcript_35868/g.83636 Transcript_35868/m.83636 type:complete len:763 (-) Transcript_35868:137-2425(-)
MQDLSSGLKFIWSKDLIHRDIKPQNLLLTSPLPLDELHDPCRLESDEAHRQRHNYPSSQFHLKIADFGFARHLERAALAETLCGSPLYMAPEILQHQSYDAKADIWSAGTVLFEMIAGKPPFNGENHMDLLRNIQRKAVRLPPGVKISDECVSLLRCTLNRIPIGRASFQQFFDAADAFVDLGHEGTPRGAQGEVPRMTEEVTAPPSVPAPASPDAPVTMEDSFQTAADASTPTNVAPSPSAAATTLTYRPSLSSKPPTSYFSPLSPSPPGPGFADRAHTQAAHPYRNVVAPPTSNTTSHRPTFTLAADSITHRQNAQTKKSLPQPLPLPQPPEDEFVMVEHGIVPANGHARNVTAPRHIPPKQKWNPSQPPPHLYHPAKIPIPADWNDGRYLAVSGDHMMKAGARQGGGGHGLLGTSPGTGGALMAMMTRDRAPTRAPGRPPSLSFSQIGASGGAQIGSFDLAAKMLAAAEDVGRRSVNVAHLGDTRAYHAMKMMLDLSRSDDDPPALQNGGVATLSTVSETDEEMPFAYASESPPSFVGPARTPAPFPEEAEAALRTSRTAIHAHFVEALSCYVKALTLMKGAVGAAQRVMDVLGDAHRRCPDEDLLQRCELSLRWLGDQFRGILERAEAANAKVQEGRQMAEAAETPAVVPVGAEELIYDHALRCGKDGAVKQLLGRHWSARSCYRSAGLLTEVLLMEPMLGEEDRKVLEGYVDEFAERLVELDDILSHEETQKAAGSTGNMVFHSSVAPATILNEPAS